MTSRGNQTTNSIIAIGPAREFEIQYDYSYSYIIIVTIHLQYIFININRVDLYLKSQISNLKRSFRKRAQLDSSTLDPTLLTSRKKRDAGRNVTRQRSLGSLAASPPPSIED